MEQDSKDMNWKNIGANGTNIMALVDEYNILHLQIDLNQDYGIPEGNKAIRVATVGKAPRVHNTMPIYMNLSIYKYPPRK